MPLGSATSTTSSRITNRQQALKTWLLPEIGHLQCRHGVPVAPGEPRGDEPQRSRIRVEAKHRYRTRVRAANRRARIAEAASLAAEFAGYGEPPF
ncbi:hypothetical protein [Gordonia hydrophobica]|uniref:Uncharacterized protein n=1 Tax=Gordonia hydrophobica TaxID=40516 RepID=A0ABZ2U059_9ACTN|nr:hypothetical protein [Gordonia hydrophobica]MBM7369111.1 hypothetical protein [Gordonia hydrophobica]